MNVFMVQRVYMLLSLSFMVVGGILILYLAWRTNDVRRLMRRKRFELRTSLSLDEIYAEVLTKNPNLNMDFSTFCKHWGRISAIMDCDPLKLRPEDSFSDVLSAVKGFPCEDECLDVFEYFRKQLRVKSGQRVQGVNTLSELLVAIERSNSSSLAPDTLETTSS